MQVIVKMFILFKDSLSDVFENSSAIIVVNAKNQSTGFKKIVKNGMNEDRNAKMKRYGKTNPNKGMIIIFKIGERKFKPPPINAMNGSVVI